VFSRTAWGATSGFGPSFLRQRKIEATSNYSKDHKVYGRQGTTCRSPLISFHPGNLDVRRLLGLCFLFETLVDHELVHLFPRLELVQFDLFELLILVVKDCHHGPLSALPLDLNVGILANLSLVFLVPLEEQFELQMLVEGSRGAADYLGLDGLGQVQRCSRQASRDPKQQ